MLEGLSVHSQTYRVLSELTRGVESSFNVVALLRHVRYRAEL